LSDKLPFNLGSITEHMSKLRLTGGLAGKMCYVLIFVAISMAIIVCSVHTEWIAGIALVMIFFLTLIILWRLLNLANKNPQSALMEGAELLMHQQMVMGTKNNPRIIVNPGDTIEKEPLELTLPEIKTLNKPEQEPAKSSHPLITEEEGR
jgi:uncharacterized ion transporter superfamily protein YfcC